MNAVAALVLSLPTRDSTVRMRVWRALKSSGCGVLRDGVYLLPADASTVDAFREVESQVREVGGFAMTVGLDFRTPAQRDHARKLFDRTMSYAELVARLKAQEPSLRRLGAKKAGSAALRHRRAFDDIAAIDFFPGEAQTQAREAVEAFDAEVRRVHAKGEPRSSAGRVRRVDLAKYRGRTWATRKDAWIDRLASAWLIKRFIDRDARFVWLDKPRDCPKKAVGFDFDGAQFTHVGNRITFEVLIAAFGLEGDSALASIASAVHFLDAGGIPVADARGIETLLRGITQKARNDDERISKANGVFDHLYAAYSGN